MRSDGVLLEEYVADRSEEAFSVLVGRHLPLVYSVAWRQTQDGDLAKDIAQEVFLDVAKNASALTKVRVLPGWLYQHTVFLSRKALRSEQRRKARELEMHEEVDQDTETELRGKMFDALEKIKPAERDVLILRYVESRSLKEVGEALKCSEEASRKRIERALEAVRKKLGTQGESGALMGAALGTYLVSVPSGLAATIAATCGGTVAKGSILSFTILEVMKNKAKAVVAAAAMVAGAVTAPLVMLKEKSGTTMEQEGVEQLARTQGTRQGSTNANGVVGTATGLEGFSWAAIESTNFFQYMANLRRIGCPEETIRDIIVSEVNTLFKERRGGMRAFPEPIAYWESGVQLKGAARERLKEIDAKLLEEKRALLKELLNLEVHEEEPVYTRAELDKQLLEFVKDPQKRDSAERMRDEVEGIFDRDILPLTEGGLNETERVRYVEFRKLEREKMKRILTSEELEEFELRASILADRLRFDFVGFSLTEDEFRRVFREAKEFQLALDPYYWGGDEQLMTEQMAVRAKIRERVGEMVGARRKLEGDAARQQILQATLEGVVAGRTRADGKNAE